MQEINAIEIRAFLLEKYADSLGAYGINAENVSDEFDFLTSGVIDSFGILEMISSIEDRFEIQLDLENLDAEKITVLGPLSAYAAENGKPR
jgi:acyl carrier protein